MSAYKAKRGIRGHRAKRPLLRRIAGVAGRHLRWGTDRRPRRVYARIEEIAFVIDGKTVTVANVRQATPGRCAFHDFNMIVNVEEVVR